MSNIGVIGLGDMGSGLAKNLIAAGFQTYGVNRSQARLKPFEAMGGIPCDTPKALGAHCTKVFIMVMNGAQVQDVLFGKEGLLESLPQGSTIILTATIKPQEARMIGATLNERGITMIDSPVSGGFPGAQNGTLTMMAAGSDAALAANRDIMQAISSNIHHVGQYAGDGQTVKACLQSLIGAQFSATFEAAALAAKAGVSGQVLLDVFSTSSASCGIVNNALEKIIDRQFEGTGSHINTMHKDLTIALSLGEELCVPLHTASAAMQIFHAGKSRFPDGDNWACTKVIEHIVGAELHREPNKKA